MRLCLVAAKPTDAVTYGLLPAADRSATAAACEKELWSQARHVLTEAAAEHAWPPELRAVLAGVPLPAKANLRQSEPRRLELAGTSRFHVESPHELTQLGEVARAADRRADVLLRVNPSYPAGQAALVMGGKPSGSGTWWRSGWPGRTPGTSRTTGSSCTRPLRSIT